MANLDGGKIKKLKRGELIGNIALVFCGIVLVYFAVCFSVARVNEAKTLELVTLITAPVFMLVGIAVAAFCNLKYGAATDKLIRQYIVEVCVENAAVLHPERNSLSFYLSVDDKQVVLQVNGYKEKLIFDFSAFGKMSASRKLAVLTETENRLCATFCRLYERGAAYKEVTYCEREGSRRKSGRVVYIIKDGEPDKKTYKNYLKNK